MGIKLVSVKKRSATIVKNLQDGTNVSAFINKAIQNEILPTYSQLRTEALYLLDLIADGDKKWTDSRLIMFGNTDSQESIPLNTQQILSRGIEWLMRGHQIQNPAILYDIIFHYHSTSWNGGIKDTELNENVVNTMKEMRKIIKEINSSYNDFGNGLGSLARDVLDNWDNLWDREEAYNILQCCVLHENIAVPIEPMYAIEMLKHMETQFIIEAIGEEK